LHWGWARSPVAAANLRWTVGRLPTSVPNFEREQYLYLTTRGRKTNQPREIEIWFTEHESRFYVMAEYPTSHWIQNLRAHPEVQVRVAGKTVVASARVLSSQADAKVQRAVQKLFDKKYGWSDGLVVELTPELGEQTTAQPPG
jgi:deazaflavin-dependent oxidoreductase (nitroreductase family)